MAGQFDLATRRNIRNALARDAYARGVVRVVDDDLSGHVWLVATHRGLFAVSPEGAKLVAHGWFFGICRHDANVLIFENCGLRDRSRDLGRIIRLELRDGRLCNPAVLINGLQVNCHQIRVIDDALCVVDTANQAIRRFTLDGVPIDVVRPFPPAAPSDTSGAYLHINSIAEIDERIALILHNGNADPAKPSELAWLDRDWRLVSREPLAGHHCHDVVADKDGMLWHSASATGEIVASNGRRVQVAKGLMTRGIAFAGELTAVGVSSFGPRQVRDGLLGSVALLDRNFTVVKKIPLEGPPADILSL